MTRSAALTSRTHRDLASHLLRADGQEDLVFALWRPSRGEQRQTAIIREVIWPADGDRVIHGNAAFLPTYFERALSRAVESDAGLAFFHAHPGAHGWQDMSGDDVQAERSNAPRVFGGTGLPFIGLTMAADRALSGRFWERVGPHRYARISCETVRVVGDALDITFDPKLLPPPRRAASLARTTSAWGPVAQAQLARLRVGIVGLGSVGSIVAEALARTGIANVRLIDFDSVKTVNLDRLIGLDERDVALARSKVDAVARRLRWSSRAVNPCIDALESSVVEVEGFRAALDCDVIFSCVDRPWPRAALNLIALAHLIPVIDGGIAVRSRAGRSLIGADWRAHVAAPGRRCLECLGQYDPGLVAADREGYFDSPTYIAGLAADHPILRNENVFAFSLAAASLEVLHLLAMTLAPAGIADVGALTYHAVTASLEVDHRDCETTCLYNEPPVLASGDRSGLVVTGRHEAAERERNERRLKASRPIVRLRRYLQRASDLLSTFVITQEGAISRPSRATPRLRS